MKIGYQAGLKLLRCGRAAHRHDALPARLGGALRAASRTSTSGATGSRSSASTCATRRASRRSAASCSRLARRLDFIINNACQTVRRPPEFYAHMMAGETRGAAATCRSTRASCSARYEGLRGYHMLPRGGATTGGRRRRSRDWRTSPGLTHAAAAVAGAAAARGARRRRSASVPAGPARPGSAAGRSARAQLLAPAAGRSARRWSCSRCSS